MDAFELPVPHPIDLEAYPRRRTYEAFLDFDNPTTSRTIQVDITSLLAYVRSRGYKFTHVFGFVLMRAVNLVPEFRQRIQDDLPVVFDRVVPCYTVLDSDKQIAFARGVYTDHFEHDHAVNVEIVESVRCGNEQNVDRSNKGIVYITNNPWNTFTSLEVPYSRHQASIPVFAIGKMYNEGDVTKVPLAMRTHHSFIDGYHIGCFLDTMTRHLEEPALLDSRSSAL